MNAPSRSEGAAKPSAFLPSNVTTPSRWVAASRQQLRCLQTLLVNDAPQQRLDWLESLHEDSVRDLERWVSASSGGKAAALEPLLWVARNQVLQMRTEQVRCAQDNLRGVLGGTLRAADLTVLGAAVVAVLLAVCTLITYRNSARRIRLQTALEHREAELRKRVATLEGQAALLNVTHDSILVRELDGRISFWNRGAETTYGWTTKEALGHVAHELLQTRFPQPLQEIEAIVLREGQWEGQLGHTRKDGYSLVVSSRWVLDRDENGRAGADAGD